MRIHHLNCACMCPVGGELFDGFSKGMTARLICHCLLIETDNDGLILLDTGFGMRDVAEKTKRLSTFFTLFNNIQFKPEQTALYQIQKMGFSARDVRHIVLTHLDFDHAGGLEDFPEATVHVLQAEMDMAHNRHGFIGKRRYRPQQWDNVQNWQFYPERSGEDWFGFDAVRQLRGLPPEILFVPLPGHTMGHAGIAVQTTEGWLFNAGDAYFYRHEMAVKDAHCTPGLHFYQWMMEQDRAKRLANHRRLHQLMQTHSVDIRMFCSHDMIEFQEMKTRLETTNAKADSP